MNDIRKSAITIGKFDGLHRGHQKLIQKVADKSEDGFHSIALTFDMPDESEKMLLTSWEKHQMLEKNGIQTMIEYPFTADIMRMSPVEFVIEILCKQLQVKYLAVGDDFRFGYQRQGDVSLLYKMAKEHMFILEVIERESFDHEVISSTKIREYLSGGNMEKANAMLGYDYFIEGEVIRGNQLGRTWGFPTMNIAVEERKLLPPNGVYTCVADIDNETYAGITNIGNKPTIGANYEKSTETYLYHCNKDLYGKIVHVSLKHFKRKEQKFENEAQLIEQIRKDVHENITLK